jgi:flagellar biosynthesis protein FlhF
MRLKSYYAASLSEAIKLARAELGPDAVILSSQPSESGGGIQLTAALDPTVPEVPEVSEAPEAGIPGAQSPIEEIGAALGFHGVPPGLSDRLIAAAAGLGAVDAETALAGALSRVFRFKPKAIAAAKSPILLVGPPGAGKTATAAKLCALARLDGRSAALITMDTVKAGALAQAAVPADGMDVTLGEATDVASLLDAVAACGGAGLVLVDTIGANPFDAEELGMLARLAKAISAKVVLVLPAGGDVMESADLALTFAEVGAGLLCPTRLDASRRLGGVLAAAGAAQLAFFAAGVAPQIAGGLAPLTPRALAGHLLNPQDAGAQSADRPGAAP